MRPINKIIVHCSASPNDRDIGAKEIKQWHIERGWSDIGYHYVIRRDGTVEPGRDVKRAGAHCEGENKASIGICLVGLDKFNPAQFESLRNLIKDIKTKFGDIPAFEHRVFPSAKRQGKVCPGFWLNDVLD